ncbi:MAG TPA: nicotinamide-nucleotide amidohydrolase family protein [Opitutaceae bacterium]|nr:nicotinamide-nucleotide amidohydrolase family protein [Opitutaceae bacterium]
MPARDMDELKALLLREPRWTLAVAESITCGHLQARIGAVSGASEFFIGGITAYTLDEKVRHLGVERAAAEAVNSVSATVAEQMACGACVLFGSDFALATTGYAEPFDLARSQPSAEGKIAEPFAWWALARAQAGSGRDKKFLMRSGRVDGPGLTRVAMQEKVAGCALAELVNYLRAVSIQR